MIINYIKIYNVKMLECNLHVYLDNINWIIKYCNKSYSISDALTGVLRVWNVSKSTPIESIRLKKTGFHILHAFCPTQGATSDSPNSCTQGLPASVGSGSLSAGQYALPPAHVVCTFLDGGVGLYDLGKRRWNFLRDYVSDGF